jgi:hypothetical protein
MVMIVAVALLTVVVMVVLVLMVMIVAVALLTVVVMVVLVLMVMIVAVAFDVLVQVVVQPGVVDRVEHHVPQVVLVDVEDGAHEGEVHLLGGLQGAVVLDPVLHVDQVQGHPGAVVEGDGGLDVAEHAAGLVLHPLADPLEGLGEPGLGVGVPAGYGAGQADCASARLLDGRGLVVVLMVVVLVIVVVMVVAVALLAVVMVVLVVGHFIIS